jgi:hypothetical protein
MPEQQFPRWSIKVSKRASQDLFRSLNPEQSELEKNISPAIAKKQLRNFRCLCSGAKERGEQHRLHSQKINP